MAGVTRELKRLVKRFNEEGLECGLGRALSEALKTLHGYAAFPLHASNRHPESFSILGRELSYFRHPYNRAWLNERSVELALAFDFLAGTRDDRILELGNVTVHYGAEPHDVIDKYEDYPGVFNQDIVTFQAEPYDAILSLSTLEHVGWDERPREPEKVLKAYQNLKSLLKPGGRMLVTCPLGYNSFLDGLIFDDRLDFPVSSFLKRVSRRNTWVEATKDEVRGAQYGSPFPNANALFVARFNGSAN